MSEAGAAPQGSSFGARFARTTAALALSYQSLAILAVNFPGRTALSAAVQAPFRAWLSTTEQWQMWDMFDTIPYDHRFEVRASAVDSAGVETPLGPVLPDLTPFQPSLRLTTFFYRIYPGADSSPRYWDTYVQRLCAAANAAAAARHAPRVASVLVDFVSYRTRSLAEIRGDGAIAKLSTSTRGPVRCAQPP